MSKKHEWFVADPDGLRQILARKGKAFIIYELIQNAWDQNTTYVYVVLQKEKYKKTAILIVEDDDPDGFMDLSHAYTLFGQSTKKHDPEKRGIFDIGEKLVIAFCEEAMIETTKGTIKFTKSNGRVQSRKKRPFGSRFTGHIIMTQQEIDEVEKLVDLLIPSKNTETTFNGRVLMPRTLSYSFKVTLPTQFADKKGLIHRTQRKTSVEVFDPLPGEVPSVYEMGIPVVETGDKWHINVLQKVPQSLERDNLPPAFMRALRVAVVNEMYDRIDSKEASDTWVKEATGDDRIQKGAFNRMMDHRFGEKRVSRDITDPESVNCAVAHGHTAVHGNSMTAKEWEIARKFESIPVSSQLFPTPKPYAESGLPVDIVPESKWTVGMKSVVVYFKYMAQKLLDPGMSLRVTIVNTSNNFGAAYSPSELDLNLRRLGKKWFDLKVNGQGIDELMIHEFAHHFCRNHLDAQYHQACCCLGAKLKQVALSDLPHGKPWGFPSS